MNIQIIIEQLIREKQIPKRIDKKDDIIKCSQS